MRVIAPAIMSLLVFATAAFGQQQQMWSGAGAASCGQSAQRVRAPGILGEQAREIFFSWAQGFMSGLNSPLSNRDANLVGRSTDEQEHIIDFYCNQRPSASYVQSVINLYDFLRREQGLHDWRPAQPRY